MAEDSRAENSRAARSRPDNQDGIGALDPYVSVRAQLVARKWDKSSEPRNNWFLALAKAGLTGLLTGSSGAQYGRGLANMLAAAEIFGAFCVPLSYPAAAGAAATLAASGNSRAQALLDDILAGGAPVLPALQSGAKNLTMSAGGGLIAQSGPDGGLSISGTRFAVPDAPTAQVFLAEAQGPDGITVFLVDRDAPGVRFSALPDAAGGKLGNFNFSNCVITSGNILATGEKAHDLLDRMRFAVQLGLAAELAGLGGALVARAGESLTGERDFANTALANTPLADVLMDVTLARAYANGAAGMAQPTRTHALEIIAGARSAASDAAMAASSLALAVAHGEKRSAIVEPLSRCALVASRIYRQPQAHRLRFVNWRWSTASGDDIFQTLFAAASAFAGGTGDIKMSGEVADLITANNRVRKIAEDYNLAGDPLFRDRHGGVELDLMGLVCADAQRLAGGDANAGFVMAAAKRTARKLAASTMYAAGTHAALADSGSDIASQFISASRC